MVDFQFQGFELFPAGPARILHVRRQLELTEVGRLFLSNLPPHATFRYVKGDATTRASAQPVTGTITVPANTFQGFYQTVQTVIHELAHLIQQVPQLDPYIRSKLEGAYGVLVRHRADRRTDWVAEPLDRIRTEETLAQDIVGLVFRLGYGRNYHDRYYVPGDERSPPHGVLRPTLSASDRALFLATLRRLRAKQLSPEQLRANWAGFEEFYRRALSLGWVGEDPRWTAMLADERRRRGGAHSAR